MNRKSERGESLIAVLVALALFVMFLGMTAQSLVSIMQGRNEANALSGVSALMEAETKYHSTWNTYAYSTVNLNYLNDCPAPTTVNGVATIVPTATQACLNISRAYTTGAAYEYMFVVIPTVGPDGFAGTADDGYLAVALPNNHAAGRVTYCANNQDGLIRGQVNSSTAIGTPNTSAECDAYPVRQAGVTNQAAPQPSAQRLTFNGLASQVGPMPTVSMTLPSGLWHILAVVSFAPNGAGFQLPAMGCKLFTPDAVLDIGYAGAQDVTAGVASPSAFTVGGITPLPTTTVALKCNQANPNGLTNADVTPYPNYNVVMTALPVAGIGAAQ